MPKNFLSALYFLDLVLGRAEVQPEGKWQWGDCGHCQQLLRAVCVQKQLEADLRVRLGAGLVDRGSCSSAGTVCLLSPAAEIHTEILLLLHCSLKQHN